MATIRFMLRHLASIIVVVEMVEALMADDVQGSDKKALVLDVIVQVFSKVGIQLNGKIIRSIDESIDLVVELFNIFGWKATLAASLKGIVTKAEFERAVKDVRPAGLVKTAVHSD